MWTRVVRLETRDVSPYPSISQIGEVEGSKPEQMDTSNSESVPGESEVAPLDKVIIKKREKKDDRKSTEGRDLGN